MEFEQIELNPIFEKHYEEIMDFIQWIKQQIEKHPEAWEELIKN